MAGAGKFSDEGVLAAMAKGLDDHIRSHLRKRIEEIIKPDIDAAIDAAMKAFKATIEARYNHWEDGRLLKVILEDRRT